jgi:hypothetical protein
MDHGHEHVSGPETLRYQLSSVLYEIRRGVLCYKVVRAAYLPSLLLGDDRSSPIVLGANRMLVHLSSYS